MTVHGVTESDMTEHAHTHSTLLFRTPSFNTFSILGSTQEVQVASLALRQPNSPALFLNLASWGLKQSWYPFECGKASDPKFSGIT